VRSAQIESLLFVGASAVTFVVLALTGVPYLALLLFRTRLARVRDDTVDAILDRRLRRTVGVNAFLDSLTRAASEVSSAGLAANCLAVLGYRRRSISPQLFRDDIADLNPAERELMRELATRARQAYQAQLIAASPVGWLIAPVAILAHRFAPAREPAHARHRAAAGKPTALNGPAEHRPPSSNVVVQHPVVVPTQHLPPVSTPAGHGPANARHRWTVPLAQGKP
jgi:hypothetical protein